jgi:peptide/nickel transport system substrate-binding protein
MAAAACGSSGKTSTSSNVSLNSGLQGLNGGGTPHRGGTLNMIGDGDVDYMDYNASYYTIGYLSQRLWDRGLYAYPALPGKVTTVEPDLATALPVVSNGGKTVTVTIRTGAMWNTTPARQITAADVILGMKRACNPTPTHFGGLADYEGVVVGYTNFCTGFAKVSRPR